MGRTTSALHPPAPDTHTSFTYRSASHLHPNRYCHVHPNRYCHGPHVHPNRAWLVDEPIVSNYGLTATIMHPPPNLTYMHHDPCLLHCHVPAPLGRRTDSKIQRRREWGADPAGVPAVEIPGLGVGNLRAGAMQLAARDTPIESCLSKTACVCKSSGDRAQASKLTFKITREACPCRQPADKYTYLQARLARASSTRSSRRERASAHTTLNGVQEA